MRHDGVCTDDASPSDSDTGHDAGHFANPNIILDNDQASNYGRRAYVTDDDKVDIADVNAVINIILAQ